MRHTDTTHSTGSTASVDTREHAGPYQLFVLALSIVTLLSLAISIAVPLEPESRQLLEHADTAVCALFFVDFLHSLYTAPNRLAYFVKWGWIDLLSSIPAVGVLRFGRFARIVRVLRVLRAVRSARAIASLLVAKREQSTLLAAVLLGLLLLVTACIAVLEFETATESNITTAGDALWWAITTMSTVGYGDRYPVTTGGRIVAVFLMAGGVGIFGTLSGLVASWFLTPSSEKADTELDEVRAMLRDIQSRLPIPPVGADR
ncbi:MAG TPA: ion transporter [Gemmatimonas sp.]|nr:ion transporter [Gemmatimonas sp.]